MTDSRPETPERTEGAPSAAADPAPAAADATRPGLPAALLGGVAVVLGVVVLLDAARIRAPAGQSFIGPAAFPVGVGVLLMITGGAAAAWSLRALRGVRGVRGVRGTRVERASPRPLGRVAALLGLLIGYAIVLPRLSYVLSTALLFSGAALLFGSGHRTRTLAIGVALAAAAFFAFAHGIGVGLPAGPWGF
ncbi:MAG TPA: tripartite tricarboxylate transporter TctB family protein [Streptosporangiaceae bacterium]|nr:tripartite tricarboxylate transporter TctB family protein [Streptosporangiaceae bacterium]